MSSNRRIFHKVELDITSYLLPHLSAEEQWDETSQYVNALSDEFIDHLVITWSKHTKDFDTTVSNAQPQSQTQKAGNE